MFKLLIEFCPILIGIVALFILIVTDYRTNTSLFLFSKMVLISSFIWIAYHLIALIISKGEKSTKAVISGYGYYLIAVLGMAYYYFLLFTNIVIVNQSGKTIEYVEITAQKLGDKHSLQRFTLGPLLNEEIKKIALPHFANGNLKVTYGNTRQDKDCISYSRFDCIWQNGNGFILRQDGVIESIVTPCVRNRRGFTTKSAPSIHVHECVKGCPVIIGRDYRLMKPNCRRNQKTGS
jgi:hypothetical protein